MREVGESGRRKGERAAAGRTRTARSREGGRSGAGRLNAAVRLALMRRRSALLTLDYTRVLAPSIWLRRFFSLSIFIFFYL